MYEIMHITSYKLQPPSNLMKFAIEWNGIIVLYHYMKYNIRQIDRETIIECFFSNERERARLTIEQNDEEKKKKKWN